MNHYKHHLGDYAKDTAHLSMVEDGAYSRLMRRYYSTEAPLPKEMHELYRIAGARSAAEKQAVQNVVKEFFALEPDGYHQKRIDKEIAEYQAKAAKNREVGKTGGRPKKNPNGFEQETQTVSELKPKPNPQETLAISHKPVKPYPEKRIPDAQSTPAPKPPECAPPPPGEFPDIHDDRVSALHSLCIVGKVRVSLLDVRQWVADGVTEEQLQRAIEAARKKKPGGEPMSHGWVQCFVTEVRNAGVGYDQAEVIARTIAAINAKEAAGAAH